MVLLGGMLAMFVFGSFRIDDFLYSKKFTGLTSEGWRIWSGGFRWRIGRGGFEDLRWRI